jgi:hypothetical protein
MVRPSNRVVEVVPALNNRSEHHRMQRVALFRQLVALIQDTGDGEFAVLLGDALQHLPQAIAYSEDLREVDAVESVRVVRDGISFYPVDLMRHQQVLELLSSVGINLTLAEIV